MRKRFPGEMTVLGGFEMTSQTIAYGDGNADDFTHLIEHEHILKTFE